MMTHWYCSTGSGILDRKAELFLYMVFKLLKWSKFLLNCEYNVVLYLPLLESSIAFCHSMSFKSLIFILLNIPIFNSQCAGV